MLKVIFCGFQNIINVDSYFRSSTTEKGHNLFIAGHIDSVKEEIRSDSSIVFGLCLPQTSINNHPYKLILNLSTGRDIIGGRCTCIVGVGAKCKHLAALAAYVNEIRATSKTDDRQTWGIPKIKSGYAKGKKLEDMFPAAIQTSRIDGVSLKSAIKRFPENCPLKKVADAEFRTEMERDCRSVLNGLISQICNNESEVLLDDILLKAASSPTYSYYESRIENGKLYATPKTFKPAHLETELFNSRINLSREKIKQIAIATTEQYKSSIWHDVRSIRITASQCHSIRTRKTNPEKLAVRLLNNKFKGNDSTLYGQKLEGAARASFAYKAHVSVAQLGVIICEQFPWICCSPDGIFKANGKTELLEIKCPSSRKGEKLVNHEKNQSYLSYVVHNGNNFVLKQSHPYYSQIQLSLYILNLKSGKLFIYSSADTLSITVERNEELLSELIPKLTNFYFMYMLPLISTNV